MKKYSFSPALWLPAALLLIASAPLWGQEGEYLSAEEAYEGDVNGTDRVEDPLEPINRVTFRFNDFVYENLLQPVSDAYTWITPEPVQEGASNVFDNLRYFERVTGNLLQARWQGAWVETGRFAVNSTVGIAGVFRPADKLSGFAEPPAEDIGQALGAWGLSEGPYLVLPLLGPSNLRDLVGYVGDRSVHPLKEPFSLIDDWNWEWRTALTATEVVVESPQLLDRYEQMKDGAIDPYGSLKNAYTQNRRAAIAE